MSAEYLVTELPPRGRAPRPETLESVVLSAVQVGRVVEIKTVSGSTFWIARMMDSYLIRNNTMMVGVTISSNSANFRGYGVSPYDVAVATTIRVGDRWMFSREGSLTSEVRSIRLVKRD